MCCSRHFSKLSEMVVEQEEVEVVVEVVFLVDALVTVPVCLCFVLIPEIALASQSPSPPAQRHDLCPGSGWLHQRECWLPVETCQLIHSEMPRQPVTRSHLQFLVEVGAFLL